MKINKNMLIITGAGLYMVAQGMRVKTELMRMQTMEAKQEMSDREIVMKCKDMNIEVPPKVQKRVYNYNKNNHKHKNNHNNHKKNNKKK